MKIKLSFISGVFALIITACSSTSGRVDKIKPLETIEPKWAQGFLIERYPNYTKATIFNPWAEKREELASYYLVASEMDSLFVLPQGAQLVKVPLKSVATTSSTHIGFMDALSSLDAVSAICYPDRIYQKEIRRRFAEGELVDLDDPFKLNFEKLIALSPDALIASGYNQFDESTMRVKRFGIPVVYNNEWMESTPLARAEWIKFMALFFDQSQRADSIFSEVSSNYLSLRDSAQEAESRPEIMNGENFRGTWYMPGGSNWMSHLFVDAAASYAFANDTTRGSLPLSVEAVMHKFASASVWVNPNASSLDELQSNDSRHTIFKAFKKGAVYSNDATSEALGNDYWESGVVRPDWLLADYIHVLHPELLPGHRLHFLRKLTKSNTPSL
ncbi:MAG: ABC transporter substrate-binding protein [Bacteroidales bacterium]